MKLILLIAGIFFFKDVSIAQWTPNEDPLTIKELRLTRLQQKQIKIINNKARAEINFVKKNNSEGSELSTKIDEIKGMRIKTIKNTLTEQQQNIWQKKMMNNKPHKGITGLPYE